MVKEMPIFHEMIWNHPIETNKPLLFRVPGTIHEQLCPSRIKILYTIDPALLRPA